MTDRLETPDAVGGKRARTRAALTAAALEVAAEKGFAEASLDEIAARAGMTKGAIYSNFRSKAELMLEAIYAKGFTIGGRPQAGAGVRDELDRMAHELAEMLGRVRGSGGLLADFQLYALADPELRERLAELYRQSFTVSAGLYADLKDLKSGVSPRNLAVGLQALGIGFLIQSFLSPGEVTEAAIVETVTALAEGVSAKR
jgi:AcrR family transcriptional regulator